MRCVWTIVSTSVARTMRARIEYVASDAHELGALERHPRVVRVEADDDLDVGPLLERLRDAAAPEGAQAGDEDTHAQLLSPQPNHTLRRVRSMS